jgi:hypothetical protein
VASVRSAAFDDLQRNATSKIVADDLRPVYTKCDQNLVFVSLSRDAGRQTVNIYFRVTGPIDS